ncbi:multicopper oxidase family protein [Cupriavidus sp. CuC1]|uniref:multicopper oxidase family protein n=1 Tax=Cupriavidus sp. CuC1 TaxID=3373131 RepID=UPI0037D155D7
MLYLPKDAPADEVRKAENARKNRLEIVEALSHGKVSRRELLKWGLVTVTGMVASKHGLNPFVGPAWGKGGSGSGSGGTSSASSTGIPASPLFGVVPFTQPMPRMDVLPRKPVSALSPTPTHEANTTMQAVPSALGGGLGPIEGRPPGPIWAHQGWDLFPPQVAYEVEQRGISHNLLYRPDVDSRLNCGIDPAQQVQTCFQHGMPDQQSTKFWTFNGTFPPKLVLARYGEPILFRHHNKLSYDRTENGGFGIHTISTHEHNGHHGAENDGFTGAFFFPGQFYDYHWPLVLAGFRSMNTTASDPRAGTPDGNGGITKIPGDWHETMSTHWFHDHMFSFTSQNVYKGIAAMMNIYSALDRGNEAINDGVNLRLPSGRSKDWGNLDYDVNLMLCDKAWDRDGQMQFDIFNLDGFLGDQITVNAVFKPYFEVERRKYRFRILNASVSRFFKLMLSDSSPMIQIGNDGNLLPRPVVLSQLDEMGIAERYDIVIDFSRYTNGARVQLVNLAEHDDGKRVAHDMTLGEALSGKSKDTCVGPILEFRVMRDPPVPDVSRVPATLIPNPDLSKIPVARERTFLLGDGGKQTTGKSVSGFFGPWGIRTDGGEMLNADYGRVSAAPRAGTREIWNLVNGGGGWDHPLHIHFEEGQILQRDGSAQKVPAWEQGRKDVYRLHPSGSLKITMQFRDWGGMFMEHCHNTVHEDNAMLLRWEIDDSGKPFLRPLPTPIPTPQGVTFQDPVEVLKTAL